MTQSPIKALPNIKAKLVNPSVEIGGQTITFSTTLESGSYLEFRYRNDCKVYDAKGALISELKHFGQIPELEAGANAVKFGCCIAKGFSSVIHYPNTG